MPNDPAKPADDAVHPMVQRGDIGVPTRPSVTLASMVVVVAALYFGREVLLPFALALLLSFLLAPLMIRLRRWRFNRVAAVATTVTFAFAIIIAIMTFVALQAVDLINSLPQYQANIEKKLEALRVEPGGAVDRMMKMITRFNRETTAAKSEVPTSPEPSTREGPPPAVPESAEKAEEPKPVPVEIVAPPLTPMNILRSVFDTTLGPLVTGGIVIVFVIFILMEREELRDRVIRLMGVSPQQISTTTKALDDAAHRVSRYLLMQLIVNVLYGLPIGIGLAFIGVPSPVLWGVLATVLRFIPYIGPWVAGVFPTALAFAVDPGWSMLVQTLILFAVVELISNNFIETWLYGASTGISPVGILISAVFWAWLWGPIGLLMATPLTVCIVVLGRYLPALSFFSVLLGDQPVLPLHARVFQRLLALDPDEPDEIAEKYLKERPLSDFYGNVLVPALRLLKTERADKSMSDIHYNQILDQARQLIEDTSEEPDPEVKPAAPAPSKGPAVASSGNGAGPSGNGGSDKQAPSVPARPPSSGELAPESSPLVVALPSHDATDDLVGLMLSILLRRRKVAATSLPARLLLSERLEKIEKLQPRIVCISALPPYATVHARQTSKRVCARFPEQKVVVGFWDESASTQDLKDRVLYTRTGTVVNTLQRAVDELVALSSVTKPAASEKCEFNAAEQPATQVEAGADEASSAAGRVQQKRGAA